MIQQAEKGKAADKDTAFGSTLIHCSLGSALLSPPGSA
jgi:hypothetical protein